MLSGILSAVAGEISGHRALECTRHVYETDRWSNFSDYRSTAEWIAERLEDYGLSEVELVDCPADGRTRYSDWTMPLAWDSDEAVLTVVEPASMAGTVLARRTDAPSSLVMWSAPTPPGGVTGEVVLLDRGTAEEVGALGRLDGKILLTHLQPRLVKKAAADAGALGVVSDFTRNPDLLDAHGWENVWSDIPGAWMMTASETRLWGFSITRRAGAKLRSILRSGGKVALRAEVSSRLYEGTLPYVTAVVPGETDEEVLVLGHLYEQGANDNASGAGTIMEVCRTLEALRRRKALPPLRRRVRLLLMAECYGSLAFATARRDVMSRTIASLCIDTGAGRYELVDSLLSMVTGPNCMRSYADAAAAVAAREYFARYAPGRPWRLEEYQQGTDNFFGDPVLGVPSIWARCGSGGDWWHNSEDTLDKLDPRSFRDLGAVSAAFLGLLASAGEREALWLMDEAGKLAMARMARVASAARNGAGAEAGLSLMAARAGHVADSEAAGFSSYLRLAPGSAAVAASSLEAGMAVAAECGRISASAARAAGLSHPPLGSLPAAPGDGGALVPVRNPEYITCLALDGVPVEEWKAVGVDKSPRWWGPETCALWWADGERPLDEIASLVRLDMGLALDEPLGFDIVGYFRMLAHHGYVTLEERGQA